MLTPLQEQIRAILADVASDVDLALAGGAALVVSDSTTVGAGRVQGATWVVRIETTLWWVIATAASTRPSAVGAPMLASFPLTVPPGAGTSTGARRRHASELAQLLTPWHQ